MSEDCDSNVDACSESTPKARKPHLCDACGETIPIGSTYTRIGVVWENTAKTTKRCSRCEAIHAHLREKCREVNSKHHSNLWPRDELDCGLSYEEEWGTCPDEIAALAFALPHEMQPRKSAP